MSAADRVPGIRAGLDLVEAIVHRDRKDGRTHHADSLEAFTKDVNEYMRLMENGYNAVQADATLYRERSEKAWEQRRVLQWAIAATEGRVKAILEMVGAGKTFAEATAAHPDPMTHMGST